MTNEMLKEESKESTPEKKEIIYTETPAPAPGSRSVFAPIVLIAAGLIFLAANLNLLPEPDWMAAARFWPLLLVFLGLNILVVQLRPPVGTLLSLIVSVITVGFFSFMLFGGGDNPAVRSVVPAAEQGPATAQPFAVPADGIERADITIRLGNYPTDVSATGGSDALVEGVIWTRGDLALESRIEGGFAEVVVDEASSNTWFLNPMNWTSGSFDRSWQIEINPDVPAELRLDAGNGSATLLLDELTLEELRLDGGNGSIRAALPAGNYPITIDGANGSARITLPRSGQQELELDGGNGSITLGLAESMEARIEFDEGNGQLSVSERFELIEGDGREGVYETAGYASATNRILMIVETGNGSVRVTTP